MSGGRGFEPTDPSSVPDSQRNPESAPVVIAILDTGVDSSHADLAPRMVKGATFVAGSQTSADDHGHGTGIAGIAAGVARSSTYTEHLQYTASIMPVKVANVYGHTDDTEVAAGIRWAVDHGAHVLNLSLGTLDIPEMRHAIEYAYARGVSIVAASAGKGSAFLAPALYQQVIAVGGSTVSGAPLNGHGHSAVNLVLAPAEDIVTTTRGGGYETFRPCTSVAAPQVTALIALMRSRYPRLDVDQLMSVVRGGADPVQGHPVGGDVTGWGQLNVFQTLALAESLNNV